ncbi:DUF4333 domain-containing protein [Streptomyces sp. TRM68367]|nr:DUF4333 domain-containing protein [Streptomyces sp. TRM68367]
MAAVAGVITYVLAGKDLQHTTLDRLGLKVKVDGHPAVDRTILEARIEGWYNPLPWIGRKIHDVSCPAHLKAVVGTEEMCTARTDDGRVSIPVRVVRIEGDPTKVKVFWKFER